MLPGHLSCLWRSEREGFCSDSNNMISQPQHQSWNSWPAWSLTATAPTPSLCFFSEHHLQKISNLGFSMWSPFPSVALSKVVCRQHWMKKKLPYISCSWCKEIQQLSHYLLKNNKLLQKLHRNHNHLTGPVPQNISMWCKMWIKTEWFCWRCKSHRPILYSQQKRKENTSIVHMRKCTI